MAGSSPATGRRTDYVAPAGGCAGRLATGNLATASVLLIPISRKAGREWKSGQQGFRESVVVYKHHTLRKRNQLHAHLITQPSINLAADFAASRAAKNTGGTVIEYLLVNLQRELLRAHKRYIRATSPRGYLNQPGFKRTAK